jgi:hypothetical protein
MMKHFAGLFLMMVMMAVNFPDTAHVGQDMDRNGIVAELEECLCTEEEIRAMERKTFEFADEWPS